jgi:hypothetical protein
MRWVIPEGHLPAPRADFAGAFEIGRSAFAGDSHPAAVRARVR